MIIYLFAMMIWLTNINGLSTLWLHIFHIPKGVIGLMLVLKTPNSHDLIPKGVDIPQSEKLAFDKLTPAII